MTQKVYKQRQNHAPCSMCDTSALYIMQKSQKHMCMLIFHAALMISTYWYILIHAKKENTNTAVRSVPQIVTPSPAKPSTDFLHAFPLLNLYQKYSFANAGNPLPLVVLILHCCRSTSGRYYPEYITYRLLKESFTIMNTGKCRTIIRCITDNMFNCVMKKNDLSFTQFSFSFHTNWKKAPFTFWLCS